MTHMNIYAHAIYIERYVRQWPCFWRKRHKAELIAVRIEVGVHSFQAYDLDYRSSSDERTRYKELFDRLPALDEPEWMTHDDIKIGICNTIHKALDSRPVNAGAMQVVTNGDPLVASLIASLLRESDALPRWPYLYISTEQMQLDAAEYLVDENFDITSGFTEIIQKPSHSEYTPEQRIEMLRSHDLFQNPKSRSPYDLPAMVSDVARSHAVMISIMRHSQYHLLHTPAPAEEEESD